MLTITELLELKRTRDDLQKVADTRRCFEGSHHGFPEYIIHAENMVRIIDKVIAANAETASKIGLTPPAP